MDEEVIEIFLNEFNSHVLCTKGLEFGAAFDGGLRARRVVVGH